MKKWRVLYVCLLLLCGCQQRLGSFNDGDLVLDRLFAQINEKLVEQEWQMGPLRDDPLSASEVENCYHLDMTKIEEQRVQQSLIKAQLSEMAIFKCDQMQDAMLKKGIKQHLQELENEWKDVLSDADSILSSAKQGRIGQYYYFILGGDTEKVVNYMQRFTGR